MSVLAPVDAGMYWRSLVAPTDQFLLYAFADGIEPETGADPETADGRADRLVAELRRRADTVADLHQQVARVPGDLGYPRWMPATIDDAQFCRHRVPDWAGSLRAVADLMTSPRREDDPLWRVHIFAGLAGVPTVPADSTADVVVLQIAHAVGDGRRVSAIARALLTEPMSPPVPPGRARSWPARRVHAGLVKGAGMGIDAATILPRFAAAVAVGTAAWRSEQPRGGTGPIAPTALNLPATSGVELRTVTVPRSVLTDSGRSVTTAVLVLLAEVLPRFGGATDSIGDDDGRVVVELTIARPTAAGCRNNFHTVGIDVRADLDRGARAVAIEEQIAQARERDGSAARRRERRASSLAPAILESLAVRLAADAPAPEHVTGATVVSSVDRGDADLRWGGAPVQFTAGFPAVSTVHGLTHGVHGIGDTVTVSLTASGRVASVIDDYAAALRAALLG